MAVFVLIVAFRMYLYLNINWNAAPFERTSEKRFDTTPTSICGCLLSVRKQLIPKKILEEANGQFKKETDPACP